MKFAEKLFLKHLRRTGHIILFFFVCLALLIFLIQGITVLAFPYPLDYGEGAVLDQALRVAQGMPLYPRDLSVPPYIVTNYPPVFILLTAFFVWVFGPSLIIGRLISFFSTIVSAVMIGLIVAAVVPGKQKMPAVLTSTGVFLIIPYVVEWAPLFRIDMFGLMLSLMGLYLILKNPYELKNLVYAAILFILSTYTRQSFGLAAPLAAIIYTFTINKRQGVILALLYGFGGLVLFVLINALTAGAFFFHIITANINAFNWQVVLNYANDIWAKMPLIVVFFGVYLVAGWRHSGTYRFLAPYLIAGSLAALTIGKIGSNVNYLVELSAGFSLLAGIIVGLFTNYYEIPEDELPNFDFPKEHIPDPENVSPEVRKKLWLNLILFLIVVLSFAVQVARLTRSSLFGPIFNRQDRFKQANNFVFMIEKIKDAATEGPVLADEFMAILPENGITLYLQPFAMTQLANAGMWDQSGFIEEITNREFPLILIHHFQFYPVYLERWSDEMLTAIFENYAATNMKANSVFFTPKEEKTTVYPEDLQCPGAPWRIPSQAEMGIFWENGQLILMGRGRSGETPVYAIADGLLYQFEGWNAAVAIQHPDPLNPGKFIWSFYGDMAPAYDGNSQYTGAEWQSSQGVPVQAGERIGAQGTWWGPDQQTYPHLRFTLLPAEEDGSFPEAFLPIDNFNADFPAAHERERLGLGTIISFSDYTGLPVSSLFGARDFISFSCLTKGR